jgi:hypothetical protein
MVGSRLLGEVVGYGQPLSANAGSEPTYWVAFAGRSG